MKPFTLTLDWLHARTVADTGGCLVWTLAAAHGTDPQARVGGRGGPTLLVRRAIWEATHERRFPRNSIARCSCDTPLCVHPDHIIAVRKSEVLKGRSFPLSRCAAIARGKRAGSSLSDSDVERIRASDAPVEEEAARFGIDPTYVSAIRNMKARRDYTSWAAGLLARSAAC